MIEREFARYSHSNDKKYKQFGLTRSRGIPVWHRLAFTRCCFTSKIIVGVNYPSTAPSHLQSLPYCNTIARPLRNIRPATDPPLSCHTPYNILVMAISCKGQGIDCSHHIACAAFAGARPSVGHNNMAQLSFLLT